MLPLNLGLAIGCGIWAARISLKSFLVVVLVVSSATWAAVVGIADRSVVTAIGGFVLALMNSIAGAAIGILLRHAASRIKRKTR